MWYQDLTTPAAVIDLSVLRRNLRGMAERAMRLGVRLRPHVKTHRCVPVAVLDGDRIIDQWHRVRGW